jgi:hypothetical protein
VHAQRERVDVAPIPPDTAEDRGLETQGGLVARFSTVLARIRMMVADTGTGSLAMLSGGAGWPAIWSFSSQRCATWGRGLQRHISLLPAPDPELTPESIGALFSTALPANACRRIDTASTGLTLVGPHSVCPQESIHFKSSARHVLDRAVIPLGFHSRLPITSPSQLEAPPAPDGPGGTAARGVWIPSGIRHHRYKPRPSARLPVRPIVPVFPRSSRFKFRRNGSHLPTGRRGPAELGRSITA